MSQSIQLTREELLVLKPAAEIMKTMPTLGPNSFRKKIIEFIRREKEKEEGGDGRDRDEGDDRDRDKGDEEGDERA